jgi:hypothetical protein
MQVGCKACGGARASSSGTPLNNDVDPPGSQGPGHGKGRKPLLHCNRAKDDADAIAANQVACGGIRIARHSNRLSPCLKMRETKLDRAISPPAVAPRVELLSEQSLSEMSGFAA